MANRFLIVLSVIPPVCYWFIESPVQMVLCRRHRAGSHAAADRHRGHLSPPQARPEGHPANRATTVMLWIATAVMAGFALYYAAAQLR